MSIVKQRTTMWAGANRTLRIEVSRLAGGRVHLEIMGAAEPGSLKIGVLMDCTDTLALEDALRRARETPE